MVTMMNCFMNGIVQKEIFPDLDQSLIGKLLIKLVIILLFVEFQMGKVTEVIDSIAISVRDLSIQQSGNLISFYPFNQNANDESGNN